MSNALCWRVCRTQNKNGSAYQLSSPRKEDEFSFKDLSIDGGTNKELISPHGLSTSTLPTGDSLTVIPGVRETWDRKIDFLLSVIGFAVDLANVWRFPFLVYKNGGGGFLIPYFLLYLTAGVPLFYMELCLGQYNRKGAITTWGRICPLFKGIGYAVVLIAFYTDFFYNTIISYALYFFFASFTAHLPWTNCGNSWNNQTTCFDLNRTRYYFESLKNSTNLTSDLQCMPKMTTNETKQIESPAHQYFYNELMSIQNFNGILNPGKVKWQLALCLLAVYLICYFSLWKGIKTSGKVFMHKFIQLCLLNSAKLDDRSYHASVAFRPILGDF